MPSWSGRRFEGPLADLFRRVAPYVAHPPIRARGTFAGSLAWAHPAAEWGALAAALGAEVELAGPGGDRRVPARLLGLSGTTLGCEHGVCASCTVLVDGTAVRSCLMLAVQCTGRDVKTVEGLAEDGRLHPLQEAFAAEHGLQCGFCTPGFLMLLAGALAAEPGLDSDEQRLDEVLASNLCRCTGYVNIRRAALRAAQQLRKY